MRYGSMEDITKFLACHRVALVGVSRNPRHFSRAIMADFLAKGYDVILVNPHAGEIAGHRCFPKVSAVTPLPEAAMLLTGSAASTEEALGECTAAGIRQIWIYKDFKGGAELNPAEEDCRTQGAEVIKGYCPFMFLPHPALIHKVHRFVAKVAGTYPL